MGGEERKAIQVGGGMICGKLENGEDPVGFWAQNVQEEESPERQAWPVRSLSAKLWNLNYILFKDIDRY